MPVNHTIKVARMLERSEANGPGVRTVVWTQGCSLHCKGCVNKSWSWAKDSPDAKDMTAAELVELIPLDVEGVTLSGGEPFQQDTHALLDLILRLKARHQTVMVFTGYTLAELDAMSDDTPWIRLILHQTDILVAGRYDSSRRRQDLPLIGSDNQRVYFLTKTYSEVALKRVVASEVHFDLDEGMSVKTGITQIGN